MKKLLFFAAISAASLTLHAQDFRAPVRVVPGSRVPAIARTTTEGGLQRAARSGNVLQAVNPLAPREYGNGSEFVEYRPSDPFLRPRDQSREHPIALRLFAFAF